MSSFMIKLSVIALLATFQVNASTNQDTEKSTSKTKQTITTTLSSEQSSDESEAVIVDINTIIEPSSDSKGLTEQDNLEVSSLLNQLHETAMAADWDAYFNLYHKDAIFIGTDATERWNMEQFRAYASPTKGWRYDLQSRHLIQIGDVVMFDEQLFSPAYGISRGTGALVKTAQGWKIAQYHLSFPIPNAKAKRITTLIKQ
ncbi:nuclear transport factor 2 family protein [Shewanella gaetbuli]|uniref:Nuclear transport factor 2 family protein n=1 Tax=Shewanella gaetbuli TaxID=220752 RepID=A0A9X2CH87_9GAMM|nr:nuclear transport factor 2 family protein [Shewanella gaetbuli]MCL1141767.1 nuclear transport factor 2 family protein [Shewanella gaetbuli]